MAASYHANLFLTERGAELFRDFDMAGREVQVVTEYNRALRYSGPRCFATMQDLALFLVHHHAVALLLGGKGGHRHLTFDFDLNEYDQAPARQCRCRGKTCCSSCILVAKAGAVAVETCLKDRWKFDLDIRWFFSGRRGLHGWVMNTDHVFCTNEEVRADVAKMFVQRPSPDSPLGRLLMAKWEPFITRLEEDGWWSDRWFELLWPRLDVPVTASLARSLRLPFSINPSTGKIVEPVSVRPEDA